MLHPEGLLQFAGLVQRGRAGSARLRLVLRRSRGHDQEAEAGRDAAAMLGLLHQFGEDSLESILDLAKTEGMLFKWGSGTGTNLSTLREEDAHAVGRRPRFRSAELHEGLRRVRGRDQVGRQDAPRGQDGDPERRPSRHRELHLVQGERREEGAHADRRGLRFRRSMATPTAPSSSRTPTTPCAPPTNLWKRWRTMATGGRNRVANGQPKKRYKARELMREIAEATHQCGDPGMQFDTTINRWHTSKNTARINASNPCSEYMFLDDSACNLASLNLMKFVGPGRRVRCRSVPPRGGHRDRRAGDHRR